MWNNVTANNNWVVTFAEISTSLHLVHLVMFECYTVVIHLKHRFFHYSYAILSVSVFLPIIDEIIFVQKLKFLKWHLRFPINHVSTREMISASNQTSLFNIDLNTYWRRIKIWKNEMKHWLNVKEMAAAIDDKHVLFILETKQKKANFFSATSQFYFLFCFSWNQP